jgi:hypothetical protein
LRDSAGLAGAEIAQLGRHEIHQFMRGNDLGDARVIRVGPHKQELQVDEILDFFADSERAREVVADEVVELHIPDFTSRPLKDGGHHFAIEKERRFDPPPQQPL